jgi:hypothetical protein
MGTPSAAAIAVSISARVAMLLASSSGSSSLRARLVQSRAALCASVVMKASLLYLQRCSLLGQVKDTKGINGAAGNTSTAIAASGIVPAHCGPPTASGFHLCSLKTSGLQRIAGDGPRSCTLPDRW